MRIASCLTGDVQSVLLVLLAIARDEESAATRPDAVRAAIHRVDAEVAAILEGMADHIRQGETAAAQRDGSLAAFESSMAAVDAIGSPATHAGTLVCTASSPSP
jgi:hypothetical protein